MDELVNLAELLDRSAERYPSNPAITDVRSGRTLTFAALAHEARRVATFLRAEGVAPGQRVALAAPNCLAYLPAAFGVLATGACLVPIPTSITDAERAQILREVDVNACLVWPDGARHLLAGPPREIPDGEGRGFAFAWHDRDATAPAGLAALDPAFIRFSSGTTARSKGVVLSHEATAARVEAADRVLQLTPDDRVVWVLPLTYHFAVTIVAYVRAGAHVLLCGDTLPRAVLDTITRFDATVFYASPLHIDRLSHLEARDPLTKLRLALSTSAPLAAEAADRFESVHGVPVAQAYGIIEAGLPCINLRTNGAPATSVGHPVPGYEVAVLSEHGVPLAHGESGEVGVRGPGLFSAYYAPWRGREDVMRQGWFLTGDVGRLDQSGALHLLGRTKAVIFVAGVKFFAEEVEDCINRFPGIRESRVYGEPHARLGQVPRAEIVPTADHVDLDALRDHCAEALSAYKVPVGFTVLPALPKTPGGKILRR
jgi:long-chain acyl-CoA synthetase